MLETIILLTAAGILVVECIEWQQKSEQYSGAATNPTSSDWAMFFDVKGPGGRIVTVEVRR
jgi:hypothetical protein